MNALLTIALPTYNRARKLERALEILRIACREEVNSDLVDFCVLNNASTDDTEAVIQSKARDLRIRYIRNEINIGGNNNILKSMTESRGVFTWIVGDDDIILPGAIGSILNALENSSAIDFLGLPLGIIREEDLDLALKGPGFSDKVLDYVIYENEGLPAFMEKVSSNANTFAWDELVDPAFNSVFLGTVMVSVFRTQLCLNAAKSANIEATREQFDSLGNTYPHSMVFARCFFGKKASLLPRIALAAILWDREWQYFRGLLVTMRLNDLLDYYESIGVKREKTDKCRRSLFGIYRGIFWKMVFERDPAFRQDFSFFKQVRKYWKFKEFWVGLLPSRRSLIFRIPRKIGTLARRIIHVK